MNSSSIHNKTIRPGSLKGYSYYYSGRQASAAAKPQLKKSHRGLPSFKWLILPLALAALIGVPLLRSSADPPPTNPSSQATAGGVVTPAPGNHCAGNTAPKLIKISVSQRHLWACEGNKSVHDTPVITGMLTHPETLTPPGSYHVYGKTTSTTLKGSDSTGSWSRGVYYWMPFLDNEHGTYGFHDATWRPNGDFGKIDPNSADASHGCVELPLSSSKWLYDWTPVRTPVTVES